MCLVFASDPMWTAPSLGFQVAVYCLAIVLVSLLGGGLGLIRLGHTPMQAIISFVGGLMLGIAVFHLWPHAIGHLGIGQVDQVAAWTMAGILIMFLLLRAFHFHQHGPADFGSGDTGHAHDCDHDHTPGTAADLRESHPNAQPVTGGRKWNWVGVFAGLALHTLIEGIALAACVQAEQTLGSGTGWLGVGAFLAILLHKPLDALSITTLMTAGGWSRRSQLTIVGIFSMMCPLGAALFLMGLDYFDAVESPIVGCALAFSCGVFLCISLSDLLPEMEFHSHNRGLLTIALIVGIMAAWAIREPIPRIPWEPPLDIRIEGSVETTTL